MSLDACVSVAAMPRALLLAGVLLALLACDTPKTPKAVSDHLIAAPPALDWRP